MKFIFTLFLLVVMSLNMMLPLMEQLFSKDAYEQCETEKENESENEKTTEKEKIQSNNYHLVYVSVQEPSSWVQDSFSENNFFISEHHAVAIDLPPEA